MDRERGSRERDRNRLPRRPAGSVALLADGSRAWAPPSAPHLVASDRHYVVVDEIVGSAVGLTLSTWPVLDERGRLVFDEADVYLVGSPLDELQTFLSEHRVPRELRERPLRVGDVLAVQVRQDVLRRVADELDEPERLAPFLQPERWIEPPVYDVTADAREAAKVAFYAAVTPTLDPDDAEELAELRPDAEQV